MAEYVFRTADGREQRCEATDAMAAKHVLRYAEIGLAVRAYRTDADGTETEVRPATAAYVTPISDPHANLRVGRRA